MNRLSKTFQGFIRTALAIGAFAGVIVLIFIAWWIVTIAIGGFLLYVGVRRLLGGRKPGLTREAAPAVIDGEYRVESEALPGPGSRRDQ